MLRSLQRSVFLLGLCLLGCDNTVDPFGDLDSLGGMAGQPGIVDVTDASPPKSTPEPQQLPPLADGCLWGVNSSDYMLCRGPLMWSQASALCQSVGAQLARIDDAAEEALITSGMQRYTLPFWIGGALNVADGTWHWPDGFEFWPQPDGGSGVYTNWRASTMEPNNLHPPEECVEIAEGGWNDQDCVDELPFVCEL